MLRFLMAVLMVLAAVLPATGAAAQESAYDRVTKSGVLRCGYLQWPKWVERDVNTGKISGAWAEYVEQTAAALDLKVEWAAEVDMGSFAAALDTGKIDAYCLAMAPMVERAARAYFITPPIYAPFYAYTRADNTKINSLAEINDPAVRVVAAEGEETTIIVRRKFQKATIVTLSGLSGGSDMLMSLVANKADVMFTDPMTAATFNANNPATPIKSVGMALVLGASLVVGMGENRLKTIFDTATADMVDRGIIDEIMEKYGFKKGQDYLTPALPYQPQQAR